MTTDRLNPPPMLAWARAILEPAAAAHWSLADWDRVVRLARRHRLLARLATSLQQAGLFNSVPAAAKNHLIAATHLSQARTRAMVWAIEQLPQMLDHPTYPLVLLKGAAYVGQALTIAHGRLPSDLDILVPKQNLPEVRFRLQQAGWRDPPLDEHDRRYYLEWSHELPPMQHDRHAVELDVHHNILPPRSGQMVDARLLLSNLRPSRWPHWKVFSPADQLLHSAGHLFFDAEPRDRIRDLIDMDGLITTFGADASFWQQLPQRAQALGLIEPLALACHFTQAWLGTSIPATVHGQLLAHGLIAARLRWLIPLMAAVLRPTEPDRPDPLQKRLAATIVLARYHRTRLPVKVLLPHLWRKWRAPSAHEEAA